jgi:hypothetical protein
LYLLTPRYILLKFEQFLNASPYISLHPESSLRVCNLEHLEKAAVDISVFPEILNVKRLLQFAKAELPIC